MLVGVGGVLLVAQEDHAVAQQRGAQLGDRRRVDVAAHPDAADDRADHAADPRDVDVPVGVAGDGGRLVVMEPSHLLTPFDGRVRVGRIAACAAEKRIPTIPTYLLGISRDRTGRTCYGPPRRGSGPGMVNPLDIALVLLFLVVAGFVLRHWGRQHR
ncbi:hypothetical protein GCM10017559_68910 [Streptosporangium longisporum]|uniref:Uncharacterized protein n=1 Tax=Streptosporangium longisporum TaxID=46187 RepID=A0ABP6L419_9ACTN